MHHLLLARSRFPSVPSVPSVVKAFDFPHSEPRHAEDPRLVHQQKLHQALIKIYVRLVIAQSIQLSNIVLVDLRRLSCISQLWVLLTSGSHLLKTFARL